MSLSTYAELKAATLDFAHRSDLAGVFDDLARRAEARLNRKLRLLQQEQRTTLSTTLDSRTVSLPTGFLEMISLGIEYGDNVTEMLPIGAIRMNAASLQNTSALPVYYRVGATIEFEVKANAVYTLQAHWFKKWDLVNDSSNWLLSNWPDLYMDAILSEIGLYTRDTEMAQIGAAQTESKISEAMQNDANVRTKQVMMIDNALTGGGSFNILRGY